jgi:hypothetical protein
MRPRKNACGLSCCRPMPSTRWVKRSRLTPSARQPDVALGRRPDNRLGRFEVNHGI